VTENDRLVGTLVADRYRVGRKLGEGGMGLVYLAVHEGLRKTVALKVLGATARIERESIARFEREAIAAANLKHPNIAEATDFGQLPDGGLYLVMEYVEGVTLRQVLAEEGKLAPARALAIVQQVGAALATAHARDVVHRDLKPDNVIVARASAAAGNATDVVKVIDFGIARLKSETFGGGGTALTTVGTVFGTPEYMAPEQVMAQVVDARADQYALGVLAFELLAGKPPFRTEDVGQLMMMHVGAPVPSVREQSPGLPAAVDAVLERMLAKLPEERFGTVAEATAALSAALASGAPVAAAPAAPAAMPPARAPGGASALPQYATAAPARRDVAARSVHRTWLILAIAGGAVLLLVGGVLVVALLVRSSSAPASPPIEILGGGTEGPAPTVTPAAAASEAPSAPREKGKGKAKKW
jgi:serine/threonine-protein kinase